MGGGKSQTKKSDVNGFGFGCVVGIYDRSWQCGSVAVWQCERRYQPLVERLSRRGEEKEDNSPGT
jgi:hypothetical protein